DEDGVNDIVVGLVGHPYVRVYYGTDWSASDQLTATASVLSVDIGYFNGDTYLDVVAGTTDNKVLIWINGQVRDSWTRSTIATTSGDVLAVRAGDVDGDYWDDIVYGTDSSVLVFLRHVKGQYWESHDVNMDPDIETAFYDIDLGDASRGILLNPTREE
ncbi:MAG: VCBS repeat-containing protein, partial [Thermoplasmata archaeon]|nr:VCBS repeat-containing protein [Thermoplasmata archaeon]